MSLFIGKQNSGDSVLHITKLPHSIEEMKSGILPDTVFHNDLPFYRYKIHTLTGSSLKSGYVDGPASGNNWPINGASGATYTIRRFGMTVECANDVCAAYLNGGAYIVMYLDANYNELSIDSSSIAFVEYVTNLNYTINYGITYCPVPYYHSHIMPCLWKNINIIPSYIAIFYNPSKLVESSGVYIGGQNRDFIVGNTNLKNLNFISIGNSQNNAAIKHINSKLAIVDTSIISGNPELVINSAKQEIVINGFSVFSSYFSLYGLNNILTVQRNVSVRRLLYTDNFLFDGVISGDYIYVKLIRGYETSDDYSRNIFVGFLTYTEGGSHSALNSGIDHYFVFYNGSAYLRTYSTDTYDFTTTLKYTIFK